MLLDLKNVLLFFVFSGKEEEQHMIGAQALPQPAPTTQTKTKDDAYDQFMREMEGLI